MLARKLARVAFALMKDQSEYQTKGPGYGLITTIEFPTFSIRK